MKRLIWLAGTTAAVVVVAAIAYRAGRTSRPPVAADSGNPPERVTTTQYYTNTSTSDPRVSEIEQRIQALEARPSGEHPANPARPAVSPRPSDEDARQRAERNHARFGDRFVQEQVDPAWGASTSKSLANEFGRLGQSMGFKAISVECHTTMCAAELEWPNSESAARGARAVVEHMYSQNCARTIYRPPPTDDGPYHVTMYMDCERARTGE
jgi:hypothetical protein